MLLLIDNYDSFTYNLVQYFGELGVTARVVRNDEMTIDALLALGPTRVVISPGPGRPEAAGVTMDAVRAFGSRIPTLGVCLGHQAIGAAFDGKVVRAPLPRHGKTSAISHDGRGLFAGLAPSVEAARYHSLVVDRATVPADLEVCAQSEDDGLIMGLRHRSWPLHGVQFHPESVLTTTGRHMLRNFLEL